MDMISSPATQLENSMKSAMASRIALSLGLLALTGAGVAAAAQPIQDGQEQARQLLSGSRFPPGDAASPAFAATASAGVLDPQEQGREMIVGRPAVTTAAGQPGASRDERAAADRKIEGDPLEMARQMILGRHSTADLPKARLAGKAR
jgi:hypothetical protein